jgi:hypothetical protein
MEPSERVTWEDCPNCRRPAAVGWVDGQPTEFDCPRGCGLSAEQIQAFTAERARPRLDGRGPAALSEPGPPPDDAAPNPLRSPETRD